MKKLFITAACAVLCILMNACGERTVASGLTGNCTWKITRSKGNYTLTIRGSGTMGNYTGGTFGNRPAWWSHRFLISKVKIENGVTSIGNHAFSGHINLQTIIIPNSVISIGSSAFWLCRNLTSITLPNNLVYIGGKAFMGTGLTSIIIPNSVRTISVMAFAGISLTSVSVPRSTHIYLTAFDDNVRIQRRTH